MRKKMMVVEIDGKDFKTHPEVANLLESVSRERDDLKIKCDKLETELEELEVHTEWVGGRM